MLRSIVRRTPGSRSGWRRLISSKLPIARGPGAERSIGTISASDRGERIEPTAPTRPVSLRGKARIARDPISRRRAEPSLRRRDRDGVVVSKLHEEPHRVKGDVAAGARNSPPCEEAVCDSRPAAIFRDNAPKEARLRRGARLLRATPCAVAPHDDFHLDCRQLAS